MKKVNRKKNAVSTFLATLILMILAVSAGVVIWAYTMGYVGKFPGALDGGNREFMIESVAQVDTGDLWIYVKNTGKSSVKLDPDTHARLYINDVDTDYTLDPDEGNDGLAEGKICTVIVANSVLDPAWAGKTVDIKVLADDGTFVKTLFKLASQSGGGMASPTLSTTPPSSAVVGVAFTDSATLTGATSDAGGTVTYTLYSSTYPLGTPVGSPSTVAVTNGVVPNSASFTVASAGSYYFTASYSGDANNNGVPVGTYHEDFTVNAPAVLTHFVFSSIGSQVPGTPFSITITAKDQYDVTLTTYSGTAALSVSGGLTISPTSTTGGFSSGVWTGDVTLTGTGTGVHLTATDGLVTDDSITFDVNLAPAVLNHFHVTAVGGGNIGDQVSGAAFSITITAIDQYDATLTSYTGTNTLTYSEGTISPTTTGAFASGVRTESVTLTETGTDVTISTAAVSDPAKTGISNTFDVNPPTLTITITSSTTGFGFVEVDDVAYSTPQDFNWAVGSTHKLEALSPVSGGTGIQYVYSSWSDGGAQVHDYIVPGSSATVTANYNTQYELTMATNFGTTNPAVGTSWQNAGASVPISAAAPTPGAGEQYVWAGWTGTGTGSYSGSDPSPSITMNGPITETAAWTHQFWITVTSGHDTPTASAWVTAGQDFATSVTSPDVQWTCTGYSIDGGASTPGTSYTFTSVDAKHTIVYNWVLPAIYVTSSGNAHDPPEIGTLTDFANMQNDVVSFSTLTEANVVPMTTTTTPMGTTTDTGTSYTSINPNTLAGQAFVAPADAINIASVNFYGRRSGGSSTINVKAIITDSSGHILTNGISNAVSCDTNSQSRTATFATPPTITAGQTYWILIIADTNSYNFNLYYVRDTGGVSKADTSNNYATPTDPTDATTGTINYRAFYATVNIPVPATTTMGTTTDTSTSYTSISSDNLAGQAFVAPADAISVASVNFYGRYSSSSGNDNVKAIITDSSGHILTNGISGAVSCDNNAQSRTATFSTPPTITAGQTYWVLIVSQSSSFRLYYVGTTGGISKADTSNNYGTPTDPTDATTGTINYRAFYATVNRAKNYQLDLEVQFPSSIDPAYTRLEIKTGAFSGEGLSVERWDGAAWTSTGLGALTTGTVNTFNSIPLTGGTLQLRFIDATKSSDTTADTWQIDYVRLVAP